MSSSKYTIRYLPSADKDFLSILDWIAKDNPGRAVEFVERIEKRIEKLETHPFLGVIPRHPKLRDYGYRILIIEKYLVFYVVRGRTIRIHRVIHGSRHYEGLL
jgi:toxin ParE1/3/4